MSRRQLLQRRQVGAYADLVCETHGHDFCHNRGAMEYITCIMRIFRLLQLADSQAVTSRFNITNRIIDTGIIGNRIVEQTISQTFVFRRLPTQ